MKQFVASLASVAPYFQSRNYDMDETRPSKETSADFEKRTWRLRTHINDDGQLNAASCITPARSSASDRTDLSGADQRAASRWLRWLGPRDERIIGKPPD
jgi:hypothetical protein